MLCTAGFSASVGPWLSEQSSLTHLHILSVKLKNAVEWQFLNMSSTYYSDGCMPVCVWPLRKVQINCPFLVPRKWLTPVTVEQLMKKTS